MRTRKLFKILAIFFLLAVVTAASSLSTCGPSCSTIYTHCVARRHADAPCRDFMCAFEQECSTCQACGSSDRPTLPTHDATASVTASKRDVVGTKLCFYACRPMGCECSCFMPDDDLPVLLAGAVAVNAAHWSGSAGMHLAQRVDEAKCLEHWMCLQHHCYHVPCDGADAGQSEDGPQGVDDVVPIEYLDAPLGCRKACLDDAEDAFCAQVCAPEGEEIVCEKLCENEGEGEGMCVMMCRPAKI